MRLASDRGPEDALLALAHSYLTDLQLFGSSCQRTDRDAQGPAITGYIYERQYVLRRFFILLQQETGLRFAEADVPYRHIRATWPHDVPLAGYIREDPDLTPSRWLATVFWNWRMYASSQDATASEFHRIFRSALWVCSRHGVGAAVRYVTDLVLTGQTVDIETAAWSVGRIAIASTDTPDPTRLVDRLIRGGIPAAPDGWIDFAPSDELDALRPGRPSAVLAQAIEALIERGWALIRATRTAVSAVDWLSTLLATEGLLTFTDTFIRTTVENVPIAVKAILSQFEEILADIPVVLMVVHNELARGRSIDAVIAYQREIEHRMRARGDLDGIRFRSERLLVPTKILEAGPDEAWRLPDWRMGTPWIITHTFPDSPFRDQTEPASVRRLLRSGDVAQARAHAAAAVRANAWNAAAHRMYAVSCQADHDHSGAVEAVIPALVLRPADPLGWATLAGSMEALGDRVASALARRMSEEAPALAQLSEQ